MPHITALPPMLALLAGLLATPLTQASDSHDHDRARQAVQAGEILPLKAILERVERSHPGQVMEVEIERRQERWIYEIKILRSGGAMIKLKVDARDGSLLDSKALAPKPAKAPPATGAQP